MKRFLRRLAAVYGVAAAAVFVLAVVETAAREATEPEDPLEWPDESATSNPAVVAFVRRSS